MALDHIKYLINVNKFVISLIYWFLILRQLLLFQWKEVAALFLLEYFLVTTSYISVYEICLYMNKIKKLFLVSISNILIILFLKISFVTALKITIDLKSHIILKVSIIMTIKGQLYLPFFHSILYK